MNENDQHDNRVDADVPRPAGMCASFGSNGGGQDSARAILGLRRSAQRTPRRLRALDDHGELRDQGLQGRGRGQELRRTQRATVVSEPPGIADTLVPGRRTNDPRICYQMGVGCSTWGAGGTAHSDCGVQSIVLTPIQKECVQQFFNGVKVNVKTPNARPSGPIGSCRNVKLPAASRRARL